jgi:type I restriction enzyme S subunit
MIFFKEVTFQDFTIGKVSEDWQIENLQILLTQLKNGLTLKQNKENNGYPITRIETISQGIIDPERVGYAPDINTKDSEEYRLLKGDLLFSHINSVEHIGKAALYEGAPETLLHGMNLLLLRPDKEKINSEYLLYALRYLKAKKLFSSIAKKAVNQASINQTELGKVRIPVPSLPEQRAIVGVLGVVDSAIELSDQIIAKTERLKRGLMQQLLTRGIGHTETKQTPIGTIPKEWQVVKLKDAVKIDQESRDPSREMPNKTFTYIDIESIEGGTGKIRSPKIILGKDAPSRARRVVHENDVIMSTVRPYLKAFAIVPKEYDDVICSTGFAVLTSGNSVLPRFLLNVLFSNQTINQCNKMMVGGQYPALNQSQVSEIEISLPPLHEQQHISGILSTVDDKLELERAEKIRFERIKRGLMDLLLTGKVRIKVD